MCCKGVLKRIVPFFLTLAIGLFIASFFVDLAPRPLFADRSGRHPCRDFQSMYYQQREENERLQQQLDQMQQNPVTLEFDGSKLNVVSPPAPPRYTAPRAIR